jgi:pimeloyl-ACP methyl ester carboxylesterase
VYVPIGGIQQWVQISSGDTSNPALLFLHGGPGGTSRPAAMAWKSWEEYFTVVHWDQRGAGQTFLKNGDDGCSPLTLDRVVADGIEVAEFLRAALKKDRIFLIGHSWGSAIGIHMIKRRPDLFAAYVGTGQIVSFQQGIEFNYRRLLAGAEQTSNLDAVIALVQLGSPPYSTREAFLSFRQWSEKLEEPSVDGLHPRPTPSNPEITSEQVQAIMQGAEFSRSRLFSQYSQIDLPSLGFKFDVPVYFFQGEADYVTPLELAARYLESIFAPKKGLVQFENYGHFFVMNRPGDFLRELVHMVIPNVTPA